MGYHTSNAAYAYDMQPRPYAYNGSAAPAVAPEEAPRPQRARRPRLDVVTGAGREADQAVSPVFTHVFRVFLVLVALFCAVGGARVAIASLTAAQLNANAQTVASLEKATEDSSNLEVMRSVYGSSSRIRDLAASMLGMVDATGGVTVDLGDASASSDEASASSEAPSSAGASATGSAAAPSTSSAN